MALTARQGLNLLGAAGDTVPAAHLNPGIKARAAIGMVTAQLIGGEGIYSGGAAVVGDLTVGGTLYPVVTMIVYDDSGEAWFFRTSGTTAIQFLDTSGAGALYAVVQQIAALSPAGAVGGATNVLFVAQLAASAAPAHSLKLGTGTITASAFTTYTPDAGATPGDWVLADGQQLVADDVSAIRPNSEIVMEGDSITAGTGLAVGEDWPSVLMTLPSFSGKGTKHNFASSGNNVAAVAARYAGSVYPLRPTGGSHSYLLVLAGTNDIFADATGATVYAALAAYWAAAVADGFEVWAFTLIERSNFTAAQRLQAHECNRLIRESTVWTRLVDCAPLFTDPSDTVLYQGGGIHPTAVGAGKLARLIDEMGSHPSTPTRSMGHTLSVESLFLAYRFGIGTLLPAQAIDIVGNMVADGLMLRGGSYNATITAASLAAARALTIPDPLASASFVLTEGPATINGAKVLTTTHAAGTTQAVGSKVTDDSVDRFTRDAAGLHSWGPGSGAVDLTVARDKAGSLRLGAGHQLNADNQLSFDETLLVDAICGIVTTNILALWLFNPVTGTVVTDRSPVMGTTAHAVTLSSDAANWAPTVYSKARALTQTGSLYWDTPDAADLSFGTGAADTAFSVFVCVKPSEVGAIEFLSKYDLTTGAEQKEWRFRSAASKLYFSCHDDSAGSYIGRLNNATTLTAGVWQTLCATKSSGITSAAVALYENAVKTDDTNYASGVYVAMEDKAAKVGPYYTSAAGAVSNPFRGSYALALVVPEVLTVAQIRRLDRLCRSMAGTAF